ncbi:family 78 glycoside hydrolase catalytic domain [Candidatus Hydrogenedentota bacterium]
MKWAAKWIWDGGEVRPRNHHFYLRKTFELESVPVGAFASVCADSKYILYVNGEYIGRGPVRSDPRRQYFDEYDIAEYLRPGENVIAALVHHYGEPNYSYIMGRAGFLLQASACFANGDETRIVSDTSWRAAPAKAYRPDLPRINRQMAFPEYYDARLENMGWCNVGYDDSLWSPAIEFGPALTAPWASFLPRDIPHLLEKPVVPERVVETGRIGPNVALRRIKVGTGNLPPFPAGATRAYTNVYSETNQSVRLLFQRKDKGDERLFVNGREVVSESARGITGLVTVALKSGWNSFYISCNQGYLSAEIGFASFTGPLPHSPEKNLDDANKWQVFEGESKATFEAFDKAHSESADIPLSDGVCTEFSEVDNEIANLMLLETECLLPDSLMKTRIDPENGVCATVDPSPNGSPVYMVVDFGVEVTGYPHIELEADEGVTIDLAYSELLEDGKVNPNTTFMAKYADRYITRAGRQEHELIALKGLRYMQLAFRNLTSPLKLVSARLNFSTYPVEYRGEFVCSEKRINEIWSVGCYTLQLCMHDMYVDCPWREQVQWWGDVHIEMLVNFYCFGDTALAAKAIRDIGQSQLEEGAVKGFYPGTKDALSVLPDFALIWVDSNWQYYMHTGDAEVLKSQFDRIKKLLGWFETLEDERGLLNNVPHWVFIDWSPVDRKGESAAMNCFYSMALDSAAKIALLCGDKDSARRYAEKSHAVKSAVNARLWSDERHAYADARDGESLSTSFSVQTNVLAIRAGIADGRDISELVRRVLGSESFTQIATGYFCAHLFAAMDRAGMHERMLDFIRDKWGYMLDNGATTWWERFNREGSQCHSWSATPNYAIAAMVMGLRPLEPGFKNFELAPADVSIDDMSIAVPVGDKIIRARYWRQDEVRNISLTIPTGITGEVVLPKSWCSDSQITLNGTIIHDSSGCLCESIRSEEESIRVFLGETGEFELCMK